MVENGSGGRYATVATTGSHSADTLQTSKPLESQPASCSTLRRSGECLPHVGLVR
jgi:hypothetical protein